MPEELTDKLPPQNIDAEKSLLGCLMIDPDSIYKIIDIMSSNDFYNSYNQKVFQAMEELFSKRQKIDIVSVSNRLKENKHIQDIGGASYLTSMVNMVPTASHIMEYAKIVREKRVLRDLISASYEIGALANDEHEDVDILLDKAEKSIFSIAQKSLTQSFSAVKDNLEETFKRIEELSEHKGGLRGLPTGFKSLDNLLAGLQKSDLIILAGRPSMGKSALGIDFARQIACNYKIPVGIFSLEMSKDQIIDRLIAAEADIDMWRLRTGRLSDQGEDNDFERIQKAMAVLAEAPIYIDDVSSSTVLQMRAMARRLQADKGLGLLIIDYLQLMDSRNPNLSIVQQVSENSKALKSMAKELKIPVLVLSQLSRAVEQRSPQIPRLSDLRDSGCLTGDALITRADTGEMIKIKDLKGKTNIPIHSLDDNWKVKETNISKVFSSGKKMVYELELRSGRKIKASANHPFRKIDSWIRLDKLNAGDYIAVPKKLNFSSLNNNMKKQEIILLAHLLGNGCVLPTQPIHYTSADKYNINIVFKSAKELFNIKPRIVRQENWWHVYLPSPYHLTHRKHNPIVNWYKSLDMGLYRSFEKEIPQKIFSQNKDNIALFLRHLWATNGNISEKKLRERKPSASIYYASTSEKMAEGIRHLLLYFGIRSKISKKRKKGYRICYQVGIQGKEHQLKFLKQIGSFGQRGKIIPKLINDLEQIDSNTNLDVWPKETWQYIINPIRQERGISWRKFSSGINISYNGSALLTNGIGTERLNRISNLLQSPIIDNVADSEVFWDEVVSINKLGIEEVFDATVPKTHNFVANDIFVHNSIEQDSDVVLFIYREDKYRESSDRKNIADIIIAKHRNGPVGKAELYFDETRVSFKDIERGFDQ